MLEEKETKEISVLTAMIGTCGGSYKNPYDLGCTNTTLV